MRKKERVCEYLELLREMWGALLAGLQSVTSYADGYSNLVIFYGTIISQVFFFCGTIISQVNV